MTDFTTPLAGVLLKPGDGSRLPGLFHHWFGAVGLRGGYVPLAVETEDLSEVIHTLPKAGFVGLNVAAEHQRAVLDVVDLITDRAALTGAANMLIFRRDGKIHADNTEGSGFLEYMRSAAPGFDPKAGPVALLGAGPMARRIVAALIEAGVDQLLISNRTRARADQLRTDFGARIHVFDWVQAGNMIEGATTVINATALGGVDRPAFRVPLDGLHPGTIVADLVTDPPRSPLLEVAAQRGCVTVDGRGLVPHQLRPCFDRWYGFNPPTDAEAARAAWAG